MRCQRERLASNSDRDSSPGVVVAASKSDTDSLAKNQLFGLLPPSRQEGVNKANKGI